MRNELYRELVQQGYTVLPEYKLAREVSTLETEVRGCLQGALCSIHLIGKPYGYVPENDINISGHTRNRSANEIQVDIASAHSKEQSDFFQLIYLSGTEVDGEDQVKFRQKIEELDLQQNDDILDATASLQDLKEVLLERLSLLQIIQNSSLTETTKDNSTIYLVYKKEDRKELQEIRQYLTKNGYDFLKPVFAENGELIPESHFKSLETAGSILLFWGSGDYKWFSDTWREIKQKFLTASHEQRKSAAIVLLSPKNEDKEEFFEDYGESDKFEIIESYPDASPNNLEIFLNDIKTAHIDQKHD